MTPSNLSERTEQLLTSLGMEIMLAKAGSDSGQFPILDLLINLRDLSADAKELAVFHPHVKQAADKMIEIVESGKPFSTENITWLLKAFEEAQKLAGQKAETNSAPENSASQPQAPAPNTPPQITDGLPAEQTILINVANDGELLREFLNESREHLDNIEQGVLVLENNPSDAETLNTIFRAFHTFKGGAGFLNLIPINRLAHTLESLLDLARQGKLAITSDIIELILHGRDTLKKFVDTIEAQVNGRQPVAPITIPTEALKTRVNAVMEHPSAPGANENKQASEQAIPAAPAATPVAVATTPAAAAPAPTPDTTVARKSAATEVSPANATVKVDTLKLDGLVDMVGELVITQSLVSQDLIKVCEVGTPFARNMAQLGRITKDLQRVSMSLRMVPIRGAFQKMNRVVRDLCAKQHKQVQLVTKGEDTELDRNIVEELSDPLMHMIRNAIDHGIEPADVRIARGKSAAGTIFLRAFHQAGNVVVEVEDDGGGLNRDRIFAKAVEKGIVAADASLPDAEVFDFIFAAGFSTAEKVTDISGRGVGMDVVRRNIENLRGRVDISSTPGKGSLFKILLPLTLGIIDGLILQVGEERYIVPTLSVRESFRPKGEMISTIFGRGEVVNVRGRLIPLLRLADFFGVQGNAKDPTEGLVVVAQVGSSLRCLLVDGLLNQQEVVIKTLGELIQAQAHGLAGATILGDGRVGLILDVNTLVYAQNQSHMKAA
jgi:two-component system, chemotaxis family, sensor kinase CheA